MVHDEVPVRKVNHGCRGQGRLGEVGLHAESRGRLWLSQYEQTSCKMQLSIQFPQEGLESYLHVATSQIFSESNNLAATKQCHFLSLFLFCTEKCQRLEKTHFYPKVISVLNEQQENVTHNFFPECVLQDLKHLVTYALQEEASITGIEAKIERGLLGLSE